MTNKRKRSPDWWGIAVAWIRDCGGVVHSAISVTDDRELAVVENVPIDTILLEIPLRCLPSCESIQTTNVGKSFADCVASVSASLCHDEQDVLIALMLAHQQEYGWGDNEPCDYRPFLGTLPSNSAFDVFPRRWSDPTKRLLIGSNLLGRVEGAVAGLETDYNLLASKWGAVVGFPSITTFDMMIAAVTSRAFAGMGASRNDMDISMVPLLDLCNHRSGPQQKNVAYRRLQSCVQACALESLEAGTKLKVSYGAKGNAQLLFNYGFALENNNEPDGSCNDVLELQLKQGCRQVHLRTGPKSYTFGCFSRAIEQFHNHNVATAIERNDLVDMETFLNECEVHGIPGTSDFDNEDDDSEVVSEEDDVDTVNIETEVGAIRELELALVSARAKYHLQGEALNEATKSSDHSIRYAGILISSEQRTLHFYELACSLVIQKLTKSEDRQLVLGSIDLDDEELKAQAMALADVFIRIRYPNFGVS